MLQRWFGLFVLVIAFVSAGAEAKAKSQAVADPGHVTLVVDADSGEVILEEGATTPWYPASLTKMMTLYLTFAAIESGALRFADTLVASKLVAAQPETRIGLDAGDRMTVREAVLAVITQSANDAAVLLAEKLGGDEASFAAMMTRKAGDLGMTGTVFRNATGLPHPEQTTTARDMAVLAMALMRDFPKHYPLFNTRSFSYKGITYNNINGILSSYPGADGLKTGFTCGSGYNLVASAQRERRRLIGVVLGAGSGSERTQAMIRILNTGFAKRDTPRLMLASLTPPESVRGRAPPMRLKASECVIGSGQRARRLPGWGLLFGAFESEAQARRHAESMRSQLKAVLKGGQVAVVRRQVEDTVNWKALLVDLKQVDAVNACLHLIKASKVCIVQSPNVLNGGTGGTQVKLRRKQAQLGVPPPPPFF